VGVVATVVDMANAAAAVRFEDLTVRYAEHPAICRLSASIPAGSLTAVIGPNGAGKSTLLNAIMGLKPAAKGRIVLNADIAGRIAYLPQQAALDRTFPITTLDLVMLGLWHRVGATRRIGACARERARDALYIVGLQNMDHRPIATLSVGQLQRALFARVLLQDAKLILLDEPFNAVDARTTADLLDVLRKWADQGRTVIAVLHDLDQVRAHFGRTLLLARRCIACGATTAVVTAENLARAVALAQDWEAFAI
jgi:zinc/manganese transport system ATP-binding protein